jgi:hypothetical protein
MVRENYKDFATSALAGNITSGATSLSVTGGSGGSFPSTNFVIVVDTELMFITSRTTDTFTIGTRGWHNCCLPQPGCDCAALGVRL